MKLKFFPLFRTEVEIVASWGEARLIKYLDAKVELKGESKEDRLAAHEWISLFWHKAVVGKNSWTAGLRLWWTWIARNLESKQVWPNKSQESEQEPKPNFRMMKEELLDIEAILSEVAACLTVAHLDIEKAKSKLEEAREQLLNLAEDMEDSQRN